MADASNGPPSNAIAFDDDVHPWNAWTPDQAAARLQGISSTDGRPIRWATAGGWALDLFLGRVTRDHEDLEIVVLNDDVQAVLDAFAGPQWRWNVPHDGWVHPLDSPAYIETHQTWLWSQTANAFVLDVFRNKHDGDTWICGATRRSPCRGQRSRTHRPTERPTSFRRSCCCSKPNMPGRRTSPT